MVSNILSKLNIGEQMELRAYISREAESKVLKMESELEKAATERENTIAETNNKTWQLIENWLHMAMREAHISEKRVKDMIVGY